MPSTPIAASERRTARDAWRKTMRPPRRPMRTLAPSSTRIPLESMKLKCRRSTATVGHRSRSTSLRSRSKAEAGDVELALEPIVNVPGSQQAELAVRAPTVVLANGACPPRIYPAVAAARPRDASLCISTISFLLRRRQTERSFCRQTGLSTRWRQICLLFRYAARDMSATSQPPTNDAHERILATAYELFSRRGIRAVGIDEIIDTAGVAKATLYRHFLSKDDLVLGLPPASRGRLDDGRVEREARSRADDPEDQLLAIFDIFDQWFHSDDFEALVFINVLFERGSAPHGPSQHPLPGKHPRPGRHHRRRSPPTRPPSVRPLLAPPHARLDRLRRRRQPRGRHTRTSDEPHAPRSTPPTPHPTDGAGRPPARPGNANP